MSVSCRVPALLYLVKVGAQSPSVPAVQWIQTGFEWKQRFGGSRMELDSCSKQCSSWQYFPRYPSSARWLCGVATTPY